MWTALRQLFRRVFPSRAVAFDEFRPSGFAKNDAQDPRTMVIPLKDRPEGMDYFAVANAFAKEKVQLSKFVQDGRMARVAGLQDGDNCEFGRWLRFVDPPADKLKLIQTLRLWHQEWHRGAREIVSMALDGNTAQTRHLLHRGPCTMADRRIRMLLDQFWDSEDETVEGEGVQAFKA